MIGSEHTLTTYRSRLSGIWRGGLTLRHNSPPYKKLGSAILIASCAVLVIFSWILITSFLAYIFFNGVSTTVGEMQEGLIEIGGVVEVVLNSTPANKDKRRSTIR
jgi:hypothetical protein